MSASDRETLSGILEVVAALWGSIQAELGEERNASVSEMLKETLAGEDVSCWSCVVLCRCRYLRPSGACVSIARETHL